MKYVPGPFFVSNRRFLSQAFPPYRVVARFMRSNSYEESMQEAEANATRAALCLNVCEGLDSADLEKHGVRLNKGRLTKVA